MFGFIGLFLFTLAGGFAYDYLGPKSPFVIVGCLDVSFALISILLGCCLGYIKNDVKERKLKQ